MVGKLGNREASFAAAAFFSRLGERSTESHEIILKFADLGVISSIDCVLLQETTRIRTQNCGKNGWIKEIQEQESNSMPQDS